MMNFYKRVTFPVIVAVMLAAYPMEPVEAFSIKTPFKKAYHGVKYVGKKVGQGLEAGFVLFLGAVFCAGGGCD